MDAASKAGGWARSKEDADVLPRQAFLKSLNLEHRRIERSGRAFVLLLVEAPRILAAGSNIASTILRELCNSTRETDVKGWYQENSTFGIVFTEISPAEARSIAGSLSTKISRSLASVLTDEQIAWVHVSWFVFPEDWDKPAPNHIGGTEMRDSKKLAHVAKRCIDVGGSLLAITVLAPVLAAIALAVKFTSRGPILFRQNRQGLNGRPFTFLKFRSMCEKNNATVHEEYMKRLISGDPTLSQSAAGRKVVYKLTGDSRVTRIGRLLRRTSLDELPQFFNVLKGEMSLVGPRPPIPYEVANYKTWHRRRLREAKPGITGLWQVHGRSRTTFDEMVRLDLKYGQSWSVWLDLKILLETPWAVIAGSGAH